MLKEETIQHNSSIWYSMMPFEDLRARPSHFWFMAILEEFYKFVPNHPYSKIALDSKGMLDLEIIILIEKLKFSITSDEELVKNWKEARGHSPLNLIKPEEADPILSALPDIKLLRSAINDAMRAGYVNDGKGKRLNSFEAVVHWLKSDKLPNFDIEFRFTIPELSFLGILYDLSIFPDPVLQMQDDYYFTRLRNSLASETGTNRLIFDCISFSCHDLFSVEQANQLKSNLLKLFFGDPNYLPPDCTEGESGLPESVLRKIKELKLEHLCEDFLMNVLQGPFNSTGKTQKALDAYKRKIAATISGKENESVKPYFETQKGVITPTATLREFFSL